MGAVKLLKQSNGEEMMRLTSRTNSDYRRYFCMLMAILILMLGAFNEAIYARKARSGRKAHQPDLTATEILEAEQRLGELGYWTGPVDGIFDVGSMHALIAFQKVNGLKPTGRMTQAELQAIRSAVRPLPQEGGYAHIEV